MLEVSIRKKLGNFSLDVDFKSEQGILALLGASGCGKSLTLKCIAGIVNPDSGKIVLNNRVLFDSRKHINLKTRERKVGYLFQSYALFPNMTVRQNIESALVKDRLDKAQRKAVVNHYIESFKLNGLEKHYPHELSGGQQQRTALARIMASRPELLLLDEPFSALDSYLKWQLELEMIDSLKDFGKDVLFVSHNRDEVARICPRVCVITDGTSGRVETVSDLIKQPEDVSAALISGCKNFSTVKILAPDRVLCTDWNAELHVKGPVDKAHTVAGVRAHFIKPIKTNAVNSRPDNSVEAVLTHKIDNLFSTILMFDCQTGCGALSKIRVETSNEEGSCFEVGDKVYLQMEAGDIMLLKGLISQ